MELDLDALLDKTLEVKIGGKKAKIARLDLRAYINSLAIREGINNELPQEEIAAVYVKLASALSGGAFTEEELWQVPFAGVVKLAEKLDKFHSTLEGDGGNPEPGAA